MPPSIYYPIQQPSSIKRVSFSFWLDCVCFFWISNLMSLSGYLSWGIPYLHQASNYLHPFMPFYPHVFFKEISLYDFFPTFKCIFYDIFYVTFYFVKTKVTPKKAPRQTESHGAGWWTPIFQWAPMHDASLKLPSFMSVFIYYLLPLTVLNVAHYLLQSGTVLRDE